MTQSKASMPTRPQAAPLNPVTITFLLALIIALSVLLVQFMDVGEQLSRLILKYTGLGRANSLTADEWAAVLMACGNDVKCSPWLTARLSAGMAGYWWILVLPVIAPIIAAKVFPKPKVVEAKDPGLASWERKEKMTRFLRGNDTPDDRFTGFMGYLKEGTAGNGFDTKDLPPLFIPREDWCQNTLVWGGIRSGKTTSFFQPNIFLAAHLNMTCIVFDIKWPQKDSGFFETIGYWHARKRRVVLLSPFEEYGARVNFLAGVNSFSDALEAADAVFPPPEFMEERGKHYNDKKRFMIAALIWMLRTLEGDKATMRDVLRLALMDDDRLMEWVEQATDLEAKAILLNYKAAGDGNFAETKNGIVSALKVFFNENVVRATSGMPGETTDLDECYRTSTLVVVGINQKNQMDGSGEVLFRLYKRMLDAASMRVVVEQGGKLRMHAAYWLDELPSIGRINYLMRSLGTLRSYNISHHLGIQNDAQGQLVYGDTYWKAISTNVVARVVMFPRGINGDDARKVSETIGMTTAVETTIGGSRTINPFEHEGSHSASSKLVERYLLSFEEFSDFSLGEAVVRMNGQQPIRTQLVPMGMKTVRGTGIKKEPANMLYELYADTVSRCPGGLIAYTNRIIEEGLLVGSSPVRTLQPRRQIAPQGAGVPQGQKLPQPAPLSVKSNAAAPSEASTPIVVMDRSSEINLPVSEVVTWLHACMAELLEIYVLDFEEGVVQVSVRVNKQEATALNGEQTLRRLFIGNLIEWSRTHQDAKLLTSVLEALDPAMLQTLRDYYEARKVYYWFRENAAFIEGTEARLTYLAACQAKGEEPREACAILEADQTLLSPKLTTREIFRSGGAVDFPTRRIESRNYDLIPMMSWAATAEAIRQGKIKEDKEKAPTGLSRRERTRQSGDQVSHIVRQASDAEGATG
ncbi:type IV secretory system conjugative DNA transfer family protein [Deinococcus gobiensis]|uniref:ATPase involved in conjugal plasmid transfer TRAG n=1 Tax=Deinococcus gobiensis (strain DSM 21396 / JCM 16679 / CGMCC 1.7299 / I-0) TaxID=745776 RepID=H8H1W8_DEIGI|nr:type IV secretory system conjugative DNA transfer family protein [Deinococcus gobiensis]AFD27515.1 ATPase involved in conjugal plasmid transfer TRAG [Deinococcus gobiensis I-0]